MRFLLTLQRSSANAALTLNYQYPLSAAIYKIIQTADADYATFLHNEGYGQGLKRFKLFTFSDLKTPFKIAADRMVMQTLEASLQVCFHLPAAAEHFVRGLFLKRALDIADRQSKVTFQIQQVEVIAEQIPEAQADTGFVKAILEPLSPMVVGRKNERGHYDYLSPADEEFVQWLIYNWAEKYAAVYGAKEGDMPAIRASLKARTLLHSRPVQQRVITIKADTPEETKVKGFKNFRLEVEAPVRMLELVMGAGMGLYNAMGCGCVGFAEKRSTNSLSTVHLATAT